MPSIDLIRVYIISFSLRLAIPNILPSLGLSNVFPKIDPPRHKSAPATMAFTKLPLEFIPPSIQIITSFT